MNEKMALLLVDVQNDFLKEPSLTPPAGALVSAISELLTACRAASLPIIHIRTLVSPDGSDRMPHWSHNNDERCVKGSRGAEPPEGLEEASDEPVLPKRFFSAFGSGELDPLLRNVGVRTVLVAGVHIHACVQATILDAYQLGYDVRIVTDAVGSYAPMHAELVLRHLVGRACQEITVAELRPRPILRERKEFAQSLPVACVNGDWVSADGHRCLELRNPSDWNRVLGSQPLGNRHDAGRAAVASARAAILWARLPPLERVAVLQRLVRGIESQRDACIDLIILEVGKPRVDAEAEFLFAMGLMQATMDRVLQESLEYAGDAQVRYCPHGVVAVITPWNNPLALPVGKIFPALIYGNTVVWKPALQTPGLVRILIEAAAAASLPRGCLNVVLGDADTGRALLQCQEVSAVTFTGSEAAGREIAVTCALRGVALQAELGGNNAALVASCSEVEQAAKDLAAAAFSFSGQRCTAPRRTVVVADVFDRFCEALVEATRQLRIGAPEDGATRIGPLISRSRQAAMTAWTKDVVKDGGRVLHGGRIPTGFEEGCWFEPTLIGGLSPRAPLVQEETFGPLLTVQKAKDFPDGLSRVNQVRQGLRAILYSDDDQERAMFVRDAEAGLLHVQTAAARFDVNAPFLGWKTSGMGLAEHGRWDRDFYTRVQAVYGLAAGGGRRA
jgi:alpha-ketoglutaric semialdehyde dehydrogenase